MKGKCFAENHVYSQNDYLCSTEYASDLFNPPSFKFCPAKYYVRLRLGLAATEKLHGRQNLLVGSHRSSIHHYEIARGYLTYRRLQAGWNLRGVQLAFRSVGNIAFRPAPVRPIAAFCIPGKSWFPFCIPLSGHLRQQYYGNRPKKSADGFWTFGRTRFERGWVLCGFCPA
jgi:hypothetical protein